MKVKIIVTVLCFAFCVSAVQAQKMKSEVDSLSYALGILFGKNIQAGGFQTINAEIFGQTVQKVIHNEALDMTPDEASAFVDTQFQKIRRFKYEKI